MLRTTASTAPRRTHGGDAGAGAGAVVREQREGNKCTDRSDGLTSADARAAPNALKDLKAKFKNIFKRKTPVEESADKPDEEPVDKPAEPAPALAPGEEETSALATTTEEAAPAPAAAPAAGTFLLFLLSEVGSKLLFRKSRGCWEEKSDNG